MPTPSRDPAFMDFWSGLNELQQGLAAAAERLGGFDLLDAEDLFPDVDRALCDAQRVAEACRRFAALQRPPMYVAYDPAVLLRGVSGQAVRTDARSDARVDDPLLGDPGQVAECLRVVLENAELRTGSSLYASVFVDTETPHVSVSLEDGCAIALPLRILGVIRLDRAAFHACWARATGGGGALWSPDGVQLQLDGDEVCPEADARWLQLGDLLQSVARALLPWRGAIGTYDAGSASPGDSAALYLRTVEQTLITIGEAKAIAPADSTGGF